MPRSKNNANEQAQNDNGGWSFWNVTKAAFLMYLGAVGAANARNANGEVAGNQALAINGAGDNPLWNNVVSELPVNNNFDISLDKRDCTPLPVTNCTQVPFNGQDPFGAGVSPYDPIAETANFVTWARDNCYGVLYPGNEALWDGFLRKLSIQLGICSNQGQQDSFVTNMKNTYLLPQTTAVATTAAPGTTASQATTATTQMVTTLQQMTTGVVPPGTTATATTAANGQTTITITTGGQQITANATTNGQVTPGGFPIYAVIVPIGTVTLVGSCLLLTCTVLAGVVTVLTVRYCKSKAEAEKHSGISMRNGSNRSRRLTENEMTEVVSVPVPQDEEFYEIKALEDFLDLIENNKEGADTFLKYMKDKGPRAREAFLRSLHQEGAGNLYKRYFELCVKGRDRKLLKNANRVELNLLLAFPIDYVHILHSQNTLILNKQGGVDGVRNLITTELLALFEAAAEGRKEFVDLIQTRYQNTKTGFGANSVKDIEEKLEKNSVGLYYLLAFMIKDMNLTETDKGGFSPEFFKKLITQNYNGKKDPGSVFGNAIIVDMLGQMQSTVADKPLEFSDVIAALYSYEGINLNQLTVDHLKAYICKLNENGQIENSLLWRYNMLAFFESLAPLVSGTDYAMITVRATAFLTTAEPLKFNMTDIVKMSVCSHAVEGTSAYEKLFDNGQTLRAEGELKNLFGDSAEMLLNFLKDKAVKGDVFRAINPTLTKSRKNERYFEDFQPGHDFFSDLIRAVTDKNYAKKNLFVEFTAYKISLNFVALQGLINNIINPPQSLVANREYYVNIAGLLLDDIVNDLARFGKAGGFVERHGDVSYITPQNHLQQALLSDAVEITGKAAQYVVADPADRAVNLNAMSFNSEDLATALRDANPRNVRVEQLGK